MSSDFLGSNLGVLGSRQTWRNFRIGLLPMTSLIYSYVGVFSQGKAINIPQLSRLDRFSVSPDWLDLYQEANQLLLPNPTSDHFPILLD